MSHPKLDGTLRRDFGDCYSLAQADSDQDAAVFWLDAYTRRCLTWISSPWATSRCDTDRRPRQWPAP